MSIMNAELAHLTKVVTEVKGLNGVSLQEILGLDPISLIVANCRKLQITEEQIMEAITKGLKKLKRTIS